MLLPSHPPLSAQPEPPHVWQMPASREEPASAGSLLWCGVFGFECRTHHGEVGHGLVEDHGEVGDEASVSTVKSGVVGLGKGPGNRRREEISVPLDVFPVVV